MTQGVSMDKFNARQAKLVNIYKNSRLKLMRTNASIWFNKMCKVKHIKPKYIHFSTKNRTVRDRCTIDNAVAFRINQEIKFLFCKKQNLNNQLLQLHLQAASLFNKKCNIYQAIPYPTCICNSAWQWILLSIEEKQSKILNDTYLRLN
jgi:hypothetical protein